MLDYYVEKRKQIINADRIIRTLDKKIRYINIRCPKTALWLTVSTILMVIKKRNYIKIHSF